VFDQTRDEWFTWNQQAWVTCNHGGPTISRTHFTGTGTRYLEENAKRAIASLFQRSFP
jgi:hypothetical protein